MYVDETKADAHQTVAIDEAKHLIVLCHPCHRQGPEEGEHLTPVLDIPAGEFPNDKGMADDLSFLQQFSQVGVAGA